MCSRRGCATLSTPLDSAWRLERLSEKTTAWRGAGHASHQGAERHARSALDSADIEEVVASRVRVTSSRVAEVAGEMLRATAADEWAPTAASVAQSSVGACVVRRAMRLSEASRRTAGGAVLVTSAYRR